MSHSVGRAQLSLSAGVVAHHAGVAAQLAGEEGLGVSPYLAWWHRAAATRFDKLAVRYEATVLLAAAINEWLQTACAYRSRNP